MVFAAVAAVATVLTLAMPLLVADTLGKRMKAVALEREKIRQRERERLARGEQKVALRQSPKQYMQTIVEQFNLSKWVGQEEARAQAGAGRLSRPGALRHLSCSSAWSRRSCVAGRRCSTCSSCSNSTSRRWSRSASASPPPMSACRCRCLFLKNKIAKRQLSIKRAFPDALDLLLICVESGMSIEAALQERSASEIGSQSIPLAEELTLTTAELSYLQDRRQAYENLAKRTDLDGVKSVCMALQQAERYGTPLAQTLRVMAQENRDMRMSEAEKKAAGLPPKLTVPMILFFLPVLFVVILGPAAIRVMQMQCSDGTTDASRCRTLAVGVPSSAANGSQRRARGHPAPADAGRPRAALAVRLLCCASICRR